MVEPTQEPARPARPDPPEAPFQALFPNLDKVSRSAFRSGTLSRRRINRALGGLAAVAAVVGLLILGSVIL